MPSLLTEPTSVSYIWIGPPSNLPGASGVAGHDISALIELWNLTAKEKKHQIRFWCLDDFVPYYNDLLKDYLVGDNPIQICSIESCLLQYMEEALEDLFYEEEKAYDAFLVYSFIKLFLNSDIALVPIADRVSCKELFSLFLLRSIGGFVLDTNVSPDGRDGTALLAKPESSVEFMLPALYLQSRLKQWMHREHARLPFECFECWAMYSSGPNDITKPMVRKFINLAGYTLEGSKLIKAATLLDCVETYLKKEELDHYQESLKDHPDWIVRQILQNARGLPILLTVTADIRRSHETKASFFAAKPSAIKFIKTHSDHIDHEKLVSPELGIKKTYNNTHVPKIIGSVVEPIDVSPTMAPS